MPHDSRPATNLGAADRVSSPDNLNELLTVADAKEWIPLLAIALLFGAGLLWGFSGRVSTTLVGRGVLVQTRLSPQCPAPGLTSISYFTVEDGIRIRPGMMAEITPDMVERSRSGGIFARIVSVSMQPVIDGDADSIANPADLVRKLTGTRSWVEVKAGLQEDPAAPGGYRWTSPRNPGLKITPGSAATVRVTIEQRTPLSYVFPSPGDAPAFQ